MEGPKRLTFTTVGPPGPEPKKVTIPKTFRFDLDLSETTDTTCPEYFYTELVKTISGVISENNTSVTTAVTTEDPFGDGDDRENLAAIAKRFEDKYNKPDGKKKKKKKWQDNYYLTDLGEGYDESDTFIDNSEAYDEVIPETMTTKLGGFYINSGRLDLKEFSDDSADDFISPKSAKKSKKRRISSDEGSGDDQQTAKKKKIKDTLTVDGEVKKKKKKLIVPPGEKGFKKPKVIKDKMKNGKQTAISSLIKSTSPTTNGEKPVENGVHNEEGEMTEEMKSNVSMAIDSVIAMASRDEENSRDMEEPKKEIDPESVPKLPPNLPEGMDSKIEELKELATKSRDGKCKFFTGDVNKLLLEVELLSKQISVGSRSTIFAHLAAFLPCSKETLLKRAKMLRAKELEDKIKEPLEKLKQAVIRVMPAIKERYEEECKRAALEKPQEGSKEAESKKEEEPGREDAGSEEDDEKTGQSDVAKKRQTGPRKKFPWDNDTRNALCDVVRVKMHTYLMARTKAQSSEEFCKGFLEQEVRPLWPKGWMQTRVLYRESKTAHHTYTNPQKPKKTLVLTKVGTGSPLNTSGTSTPVANTSMTDKGGSVKTGGVVVMSKINPSPGNVIKVATMQTNGKPTVTSAKSAGGVTVSRPTMPSPNTPAHPGKKAVPTLLDFVQSNSSSSLSFMSSALSRNPLTSSMDILGYANSKPSTASADLQSSSQTWDHRASDILRSAMVSEHASKIFPPSVQRQNSTPISSAQSTNSFLAQYANFATSPITLFQSGNYSAESAVNLSTKADHQLIQKHLESERQKQKLVEQQQKSAEKQRQIQQQKILQQKQQQQQQQQQQAAKHIITISKAALDQNSQPKPPSQSPMSLAMSKTISSNQNQATGKMTPKQLASQFAGQSLSKYSEAYIRQQLIDASYVQTQPKKAGTSPGNGQGHIQSTSDTLRKISPQAVASQEPHAGNVKSQGLHLQNQDHSLPASKVTNGAPATSLLQSLFGHSPGQAFPTSQTQRSPSRPSVSPQGQTHSLPLTVSHSSPNGQWFGQQPGGGARPPTINYQGMQLTSEQIASLQAQQRLAQTATMFKTAEGPK